MTMTLREAARAGIDRRRATPLRPAGRWLLALGLAVAVAGFAAHPAHAQDHGRRDYGRGDVRHDDRHDHDRDRHFRHDVHRPPVVVATPAYPGYVYQPPPTYYEPPAAPVGGISLFFGF